MTTPASASVSHGRNRLGDQPPRYDLSYRDVFWRSRGYEDRCDRMALRALLPKSGRQLLEIGAGFGRLANEYDAYEHVVLLDASADMREAARERLTGDSKYEVVAGEATHLPFPDASFDTVVAVRLLLHLPNPAPMFREVARVLRAGGVFIVEYPNRRHVLAIARHALGREPWRDREPYQYSRGHYSHHPQQVREQLRSAGLQPGELRAASFFRNRPVKKVVPMSLLLAMEARLQAPLGRLTPAPSVFVRSVAGHPTGKQSEMGTTTLAG
jgi:ubiquinone/menaquinone biosynthesis C-methylase UbiE